MQKMNIIHKNKNLSKNIQKILIFIQFCLTLKILNVTISAVRKNEGTF